MRKFLLITNNIAPFRIDWLDELGKYIGNIDMIYFVDSGNVNVPNKQYLKVSPKRSNLIKMDGNIFFSAIQVIKFIDKNQPDFIMFDGYSGIKKIICLILIKLKKKTVLMRIDGGIIQKSENRLKYYFKKFIINQFDFIFSTSKYTDEFLKYYDFPRKKIIRHYFSSVKKENLILFDKYKINRKDDKLNIVTIGKWNHGKGNDLIFEIAKNTTFANYYHIGQVDDGDYYVKKCKKLTNFYFLGFIPNKEIYKYLKSMDIFLFPTRFDVWGLVVNESISCGLAIISSNKTLAGKSLINNNGYIVENEKKEYIKKIKYLNEHRDILENMKKNSFDKREFMTIEYGALNDYNNLEKIRSQYIRNERK